jgi:hypothetical protein
MFHPILVPHGITDIVDAPIKSIVVYGTVAPLMYHLPLEVKASALVVGSLYHMRRDVPGLPANICIHALWIWQPWFAEAYLTVYSISYPLTARATSPASKSFRSLEGHINVFFCFFNFAKLDNEE